MKRLLLCSILGFTLIMNPKTRDDSKITDYMHPGLEQLYKNCSKYAAQAKIVTTSAFKNALEITKKNAHIDDLFNIGVYMSGITLTAGLFEGFCPVILTTSAVGWLPYVSRLSSKNIATCLVDETADLSAPTLSHVALQNSFLAAYGD